MLASLYPICSCSGDSHVIEKANGIKYLYASVVRHPDVCAIVVTSVDEGRVGKDKSEEGGG